MFNLLHSEIYRLRHDCVFYILLCAAVLSGVVYGITAFDGSFDDMFVVPLFAISAVYISLSVGREYADGTLRNKIIVGKKKTDIFAVKLIVNIAVSVINVTAFLIPCIAILSVNALSKIPNSVLLWTLLGFFLLNISWAAIFTFISLLISSREIAAILNFILIIAIMFASYQLEFAIGQPEFIINEELSNQPMSEEEVKQIQNGTFAGSYATEIDDNGVVTYYKTVITEESKQANPNFVSEPFSSVLRGVDSLLPHGQINEYVYQLTVYADTTGYDSMEDNMRIKSFPLYSLVLIGFLSVTGLLLFRKKEIK